MKTKPNASRRRNASTLLTLLTGSAAHAQPDSNDWFTVDGGGAIRGGGYTLHGAFWGSVAALPPRLTISGAGGSVTICWPWPSRGYVLTQSDSLVNPNWTPVVPQPTQTNPIPFCLTLQVGPTPKFYRLKKSGP